MNILFLLLQNFVLTVLIEGALVLVFVRSKKSLYHSLLVNMLTNPLLNALLILWGVFVPLPTVPYYYMATAVLEISAVFAEAIAYYKMGDFGIKKAFSASFLLNACSYSFGLIFL